MAAGKYVAYVGTYTNGKSKGIHIYDVDVEEGLLYLRRVVPVNNSSYLIASRSGKFLYSIADEGVEVYEIAPNGDLNSIKAHTSPRTIRASISLSPVIMTAKSLLSTHTGTEVSAVSWMVSIIADRERSTSALSDRM